MGRAGIEPVTLWLRDDHSPPRRPVSSMTTTLLHDDQSPPRRPVSSTTTSLLHEFCKHNSPWLFSYWSARRNWWNAWFFLDDSFVLWALGVGWQVLSFQRYVTKQQCSPSLWGTTGRRKGRKGGMDLAGEIKLSVGRGGNDPFAVQFNRARWGTLLFIFWFAAALTFLSPFPPARRSQSIALDLGRRNSPKRNFFHQKNWTTKHTTTW